jgi:hypothetical protein
MEAETMMQSTGEKIAQEARQQGRAEGRAEGHLEGRAEILLRLLHARFGSVPIEAERRVRTATAAELDRWAIAVLTAPSLDDVFADGGS